MKYLKLFENITLDNILDKISKSGMDSLTALEKEFLSKFSQGEHERIEQKIKEKNKRYKGMLAYDPRNDNTDFYKKSGDMFGLDMNFNKWSDKEIDDTKYQHLWDGFYDEDMDSFMRKYALPNGTDELPWDELPKEVSKLFKQYIKDIGMLD